MEILILALFFLIIFVFIFIKMSKKKDIPNLKKNISSNKSEKIIFDIDDSEKENFEVLTRSKVEKDPEKVANLIKHILNNK